MSENYSEERKIRIGLLNKNKIGSSGAQLKFKEIMLKRYATQPQLRCQLSKIASKPVI